MFKILARSRLLFAVMLLSVTLPAQTASYLDLTWEDLRPSDSPLPPALPIHNPMAPPLSTPPMGGQSLMAETVDELNGKRVRIPAFVVPLDGDQDNLTELLLVPYFGACIHVPPPPPNQIIYIKPLEGLDIRKLDLWGPVWAIGVLQTDDIDHEVASIAYRMSIETLSQYDPREAAQLSR